MVRCVAVPRAAASVWLLLMLLNLVLLLSLLLSGVDSGSGKSKTEKVGKVTKAQVEVGQAMRAVDSGKGIADRPVLF